MKTTLLFLIIISSGLFHQAWAQQEKGVLIGFNNQLSLRKLTLRTNAAAMIGYQTGRHQLAAGPVVFTKDFDETSRKRLFSGLQMHYRYLLTHKPDRKLYWFAALTSTGLCFKDTWHSNYWDSAQQAYTDVRQKSRELLWENYAGIGFQYPFSNRLTLSASADFGYAFSRLQRRGLSPETADNQFDYRPYDPTEFVYAIGVGMQIQLGHLLK